METVSQSDMSTKFQRKYEIVQITRILIFLQFLNWFVLQISDQSILPVDGLVWYLPCLYNWQCSIQWCGAYLHKCPKSEQKCWPNVSHLWFEHFSATCTNVIHISKQSIVSCINMVNFIPIYLQEVLINHWFVKLISSEIAENQHSCDLNYFQLTHCFEINAHMWDTVFIKTCNDLFNLTFYLKVIIKKAEKCIAYNISNRYLRFTTWSDLKNVCGIGKSVFSLTQKHSLVTQLKFLGRENKQIA